MPCAAAAVCSAPETVSGCTSAALSRQPGRRVPLEKAVHQLIADPHVEQHRRPCGRNEERLRRAEER